ncbi:autotransporter domain-containing protein [Stappia sp. BW2]|nr:autotransporter domain-containing protein [Stappia sp. BW2]
MSAGTLEASTTSVSGNINVSSGARMRFNQTSDSIYSGAISGAGRFEKSGAGTLSLTGRNTYTGGTDVSAGTLEASTTSVSGNINVSSGARMRFNQTSDSIYSGAITGAGRFEKSGAGTLSLKGRNTYTGGTDVFGGTLEASTTSVTGNINVSSGASMRFNQTSNGSYSGAITGAGRFEKSGAGTLSLSGNNTYTGGTDVSAGTLEASTTSVTGNINVSSGARMRFNQTSDSSYTGAVSGDGNFEKSGAGALTMTGTYSLTGETLLSAGELFFNASSLGAATRFNLAGGVLTLSGSGSATIKELKISSTSELKLDGVKLIVSNTISSTQRFTLAGGGTLNLDQAGNTFGGGVTVSNGKLIVGSDSSKSGASVDANISVASGATLGGHGSITGNVTNAGRLAPGNSIGTTTINGNLSGSGTLEIEVDGDASGTPSADKLIVNGAVDISAMTLDLVLSPTNVANWAYGPTGPFTIIENDGSDAVTGSFATVKDNLTFLDASLNYAAGTGNDVALTLLRNDIDMISTARTFNQTQTAAAIESLGYSSPVYLAVVTTVSDEAAAQTAFDSLSGEINASLRSVLVSDSRQTRDAALSRLQRSDASGPNLWGSAIGSWGRYGSGGETYRADSTTGGFLVGYDHTLSETLTLGVLAGYTRTNVSVDQLNSKAVTDSYHLGLYAGGVWNGLTYKGGVATAYNKAAVDRDVRATSTLSQSLSSDQNIYSSQVFAETGYAFDAGVVDLEPFAGLALVHLGSRGFTENGGTAALSADGQGEDTTFFWMGLRAQSAFNLFGAKTTAKAGLAWQHASSENATFEQAFSSGGDSFTVEGAPFAQDMALVDAGLGVNLGANTNFEVSYSGQLARETQNHGLNARLSIKF